MANFVDNYCEFPVALRRPMWRIWHNLLIRFDKDVSANFKDGMLSISIPKIEPTEPKKHSVKIG